MSEDELAAIAKQLHDPPLGYIDLEDDAYSYTDGDVLLPLAEQLLGEVRRLRAGLETVRQPHIDCAGDSTDPIRYPCDCGAAEQHAQIDALLKGAE